MVKKAAIVAAAVVSMHGAHAFSSGTGSLPGLRAHSGVSTLAMSEQKNCEQVFLDFPPNATQAVEHYSLHCLFCVDWRVFVLT